MNDSPLVWQILLQVFLIALNAVFACAEIAVISMNDARLAKLAQEGDKRAMRLAALTSQPARFLATIQVAITLSGFLGSAFAADNFSDIIVNALINAGVTIPAATLNTIAVFIITLILSYLTLVFGELVPKRIAMKKAEPLALGMSALINFISKLFAPLVWTLTASTNGMLRLCGIDPNAEDDEVTEEEIRMMVDVGSENGSIDAEEKQIIQNVFEFDDLTAGEISTHRTEAVLLWLDDDTEQWHEAICESRYTFYPICSESVDNVVGVLNTKDYFRLKDKTRAEIMKKAVKRVSFVPESAKADVVFQSMKKSGNHFAVVLDEYGGMSGVLTMNDLLARLVGNIDEDDLDGDMDINRLSDISWQINGSASLDDVEEALNIKLPCDEYDTFGGYVFGMLGTVPLDGTEAKLETEDLLIHATYIADHRMRTAIVNKKQPADAAEE